MDLPFDLSLAPFVRQRSQDGSLVALDAYGKGPQLRGVTFRSFFQPGLERRCVSAADHPHEGLSQRTGHLHLRMGLLYEIEEVLVFR